MAQSRLQKPNLNLAYLVMPSFTSKVRIPFKSHNPIKSQNPSHEKS
jgi:hypothetical protein